MARRSGPAYRPAVAEDLPACTRVWRAGLADYLGRLNKDEGLPTELESLRRMLRHLLDTDPDRFWVAVRPGGIDDRPAPGDGAAGGERVVGFGSAAVRGPTWFLAMLFVDPVEQARGIGRALLERLLDRSDGLVLGTATDTAQPISNALYARLGIVPRMPCLNLVGRPHLDGRLPALPQGMSASPFSGLSPQVATVDRAVLGYERPADHAWLLDEGRLAWLYHDRDDDGRVVGYGYVAPVGRIGPVACLDPALLPALVGHLLTVHEPPGASSIWVPGAAGEVVASLLRAGLRLEAFPALLCWTAPLAPFDRYLPITLALV
jgi:GNAT superfamily N-acetyltransferase